MFGEKTILMINKAAKKSTDPRDVAETLLNYGEFRTTKERLEKIAPGRDLRMLLTDGLLANDPTRKRDSADRNVRNWLRGDKDAELSRDTAMELAFILDLDIQGMNELLTSLTQEGLRWRDPKEIVMIFSRMHSMTYPEAIALNEKLGSFETYADTLPVSRENMTSVVRNEVLNLKTEEELKNYLQYSAKKLGAMHNTAYVLFKKFMKLLQDPNPIPQQNNRFSRSEQQENKETYDRKMPVREILQLYLYRDLVPVADRKKKDSDQLLLSPQQKVIFSKIKAGWPDETMISKMINREIDVTRKVLILLFLATDGADMQFTKKQMAISEKMSRNMIFKESFARINRMLGGCGYSLLDARSPFDWIVIYCLSVDSIEETDEKMAQTLTELYSGNQNQEMK